MQTPKASRKSSVVAPRRKSPAPRTDRQLKIPGSDPDSVSSSNPGSKTLKGKIPKVTEHNALKTPVSEKDRSSRVTELQAELDQLRGDLKKTKDQLIASESWKRLALQEAEEAKKQLSTTSEKLEESEQKLHEITASDDDRVQQLRKISQDRDRAWQSELEAVQKQHSMDSAALASAMNEIQRLKVQLESVYESESIHIEHAESADAEIRNLRIELTETLSLVEKHKSELADRGDSESEALKLVTKTKMQLEAANKTIEMTRSNEANETEAYNTLLLELEQSKARVKSLESLVSKLQELVGNGCKTAKDTEDDKHQLNEDIHQLKTELNFAKLEVGKLRSALDAAEVRYQEEYIRSTLQIRIAYEQVECIKTESCRREAELEAEIKRTQADIEELRSNDKRESELAAVLKKLETDLLELKENLTAKETELKTITEQNKMLEREIKEHEMESTNKDSNESAMLLEAAKAAERAVLMKLGYLTEEADKSSQRAARVTEELGSAQAEKIEMEAELKRVKVQADQWRKAAEAATAMLSNNGKHSDKNMSFDMNYNQTIGSHKWENVDDNDDDDDSSKKNGNMLKKIGVLWKKGQK